MLGRKSSSSKRARKTAKKAIKKSIRKNISKAKKAKRKFHKVNEHTKIVGGKKVKIRAHLKSMPKLKMRTLAKKATTMKRTSKNPLVRKKPRKSDVKRARKKYAKKLANK